VGGVVDPQAFAVAQAPLVGDGEMRLEELDELRHRQLACVEGVALRERERVGGGQQQRSAGPEDAGALGDEPGLVPEVLEGLEVRDRVESAGPEGE
jgi:hypothetical protein